MTKRIFSLFLALQLISATAFAGGSQPATPGGSNGQIQYNSSGALSGLTIGGDCSINVGTGALTCTKTGGVNFAASATTDTTAANNITSGTLPAARLPAPSSSTLGGVQSAAAVSHQFLTSITTLGVPVLAQPAFTDISGTATVAQGGTGVTAAQGNGTKVQLSTGTTTTNDCVKFDANGNTVDAGAACGAGGSSVSVTSASPSIVINPSPGTGTFTIAATDLLNAQAGTNYTVLSSDIGKTITNNNASATAVSLASAATTGFGLGASYTELDIGAGVVTITPTTSTINGAATHTLHKRGWAFLISDGTNYNALGFPGFDTITANALPKFVDGSGATTASGISDSGTVLTFGENATATGTLTLSAITGSTQCLHVNSSGLITGTGSDCGAGSGGTLGTSVSAASPSISGDTTTGLYTSAAAKVDVAVSGSKVAEWGTAGEAVTGTETITSATTNALAVGPNGATNPVLSVDGSVASSATGLLITPAAAGGGVTLTTRDSSANSAMTLYSKGSGSTIIAAQTGPITFNNNSATTLSTDSKSYTFTPGVSSSALGRFIYNAAVDTSLSTAANSPIEKFNNAVTRTHATGANALQEDFQIFGATDAYSGATTQTLKTTLALYPGNCGTNGTCTNITSLSVPSTAITGTVTNGYGAEIAAPTGATKNFAALITGQIVNAGTSPTTSAGAGAGTSPTIALTSPVAGGLISVTTGTSPTGSNANVVTVTYPVTFATNSAVTLTPANAATAALTGTTAVYALGTTTGFTIVSGSSALTASTAYAWNYHVDGY